ncbi:hypothetical protein L3Q82_018492 [Scortum barcoo]|uniref:Uncharacterized protein n=1 Tax=Scortum barcoo TaxID=214431 RepID=A0ACB8VFS7_9TELE|nr:hypothetical protein L3Q82_018492 [Scortum barcoo]
MFRNIRVSISAWHGTRTPYLGRRSMIDFVVVSSDLRPYVLDTFGRSPIGPCWPVGLLDAVDRYRQAKQAAARTVLEAKTRVWEEFGEAMEEDYRSASKRFWQTVRRLRKGKQYSANTVYSAGGELLTSTEDIVGRWKKYFEDLLNPTDLPSNEEAEDGDSEVDSSITQAEVTEVVRKLLGGKAPGVDEIRPEYLKSLDVVGLSWLTRLCNIAWRLGQYLWSGKLGWWSLFLKRGTGECVPTTEGSHFSASPGRSTPGHSTVSLWWYSVGSAPHEYGVRGPLLRAVRSLYDRSRSLVRIAGSKSDLFPVHVGLWQGCPLSPVLFIIFMDRISRRSQGPEGVWFGNHRISSLLFADDVVLLASSSQDLQHVLERFAAECEAAGMRISTSKSEAMVLDRKRVVCPLRVSGEVLPQVEEFKYLGVLFTSEGKMEREIDRRIGAASCSYAVGVPDRRGEEEGAESKGEALDLPVNLRPWVAGRSLRDRVRSSVIREELRSRAAAPSHREESAEVAWASISDAPWMTPP